MKEQERRMLEDRRVSQSSGMQVRGEQREEYGEETCVVLIE